VAQRRAEQLTRLLPRGTAARILAANAFVNSVGNGFFLACSTLYFVKFGDVTVAQVGAGLAIAGTLSLVTTVPLGRIADRYGPRNVLVVLNVWQALICSAYLLARGFVGYLVVTCLLLLVDRAAPPLGQALVVRVIGSSERTRVLGFVRSVSNAGYAVGFALTGFALATGQQSAYRVLFVGNSLTFVFVAATLLRVPSGSRKTQAAEARPSVPAPVRDPVLVAATGMNAVLYLYDRILVTALPIWVVRFTAAPPWMVTVLLTVNALLVVACQVPATRFVVDFTTALRAVTVSAFALAAACVLLFASGVVGQALSAAVCLVICLIALTTAELLHMPGAWQIGMELAHPEATARYLSFFSQGYLIEEIGAPAMLLWMVAAVGDPGWLALGALVVLVALVNRHVLGSSSRRGEKQAQQRGDLDVGLSDGEP
jgi:MFS family permease